MTQLRKLFTYTPLLIVFVVGLYAFAPEITLAQTGSTTSNIDYGEVQTTLAQLIHDIAVGFFGAFAGIAASFLNYALNQFVINFGTNITSSGIGATIDSLWSVVRDFFNILFIFAIIYLGFKMILGSDDSGTRRGLVYLIIAALLVNFSLFISKFVVDFSNVLATEVATASFPAVSGVGGETTGLVDVGTNFFNMMQIPTTVNPSTEVIQGTVTEWGYIFGIILVYVIAIFAFAAGAIMLIIRYAALCIFMVLSPFMFIGWILPQFQGLMRKYWSGFLGRAFFAPAYVLLLYFSGAVIQASFSTRGNLAQSLTGNPAADASAFGAGIGPFILSAVFLIMSVQVANKLSVDGAGTAIRVGGNLARGGRRRLQNAGIGAARFGARNTAGYAAMGAGYAAEGTRRRLDRGLGSLAQGGRVSRATARVLDRTVGAGLDKTAKASVAGSETASENRKRVREQNAKFNTARQAADRANRNDRYGRMNNEEVLRLTDEQLRDPTVLAQLTNAHMDAIRDSGRFTNEEFSGDNGIENLRRDAQIDQASQAFDDASSSADDLAQAFDSTANTLRRMDADTKAALGVDRLTQERVAVHLTDDDLRDMQQTGRLDSAQIQQVRVARDTALNNMASGNTNFSRTGGADVSTNGADTDTFHDNRRRAMMSNPQQAGRLPASVFAEPSMREFITTTALTQRMRNGNVSETERQNIEDNLQNYITDPRTSPRAVTMWQNWAENTVEGASFELV